MSNNITDYNYEIFSSDTVTQMTSFLIGFFVAALVGYIVGRFSRPM